MKLKPINNSLLKCSRFVLLIYLLFNFGCNTPPSGKGAVEHGYSEQNHSVHESAKKVNTTHEATPMDHAATQELEQNNLKEVIISPNNWVISNQPTVKLQLFDSTMTVPAKGYITYDTRRNNKVAARVGGRIEKLYVKYNYEYVRKGDKIMDVYSPELNTYQNEFLHLISSSQKEEKLVEEAKKKLRLLGMTNTQINRLESSGEHTYSVSIYSAYTGYIIFSSQNQAAEPMNKEVNQGNGMAEMGRAKAAASYANSSDQLREGMYVNAGETLFSINDLNEVWAILSLDTRFEPHFKVHDDFLLKSEIVPEKDFEGKVNFIEPVFRDDQRFLQVRVYLPNKDHLLKINSLVSGTIIPAAHTIWVLPSSSIYDLGRRKIVWVFKGKTQRGAKFFEAREVLTGIVQKRFYPNSRRA